jgi:hypothetical protein
MAAVTTGIMAATAGFQLFKGISDTKKGQNALSNFDRGELKNVYEDMAISTVGSDLMREESGRTTASLIDASRGAGARGVYSNIPRIQAYNNSQNLEARSYLDKQVQERNYAIADDGRRIQQMQEQRDNQDLAGIGAQIQAGRENTFAGLRGIGNSLIYGIENSGSGEDGGEDGGDDGGSGSVTQNNKRPSFGW